MFSARQLLVLLVLLLTCWFGVVKSETKIICYYTNWAQYRSRPATFTINSLDTSLCTHVAFSFASIVNNRTTLREYNDGDVLNELARKKRLDGNVTTLLVVGGWGTSATFSAMAATALSRATFIQSSIALLRRYDLDGIELDWEFPGSFGGSSTYDKQRFTALCKEFYDAFTDEAKTSKRPRLLLSAAVAPTQDFLSIGYDVLSIAETLDWVNVMAYDLHGTWDRFAYTHAPLTSPNVSDPMTASTAVEIWRRAGLGVEKIVLGIPTYGRSYTLAQGDNRAIGAPIVGTAAAGIYTGEAGNLAFYEICNDRSLWSNRRRDEVGRQMYSWNDQGVWVGFDDIQSVKDKCDYVTTRGLAGVAVWTIDFDDFTGYFCSSGQYPLLTAINEKFQPGHVVIKQPVPAPPLVISPGAPSSTVDVVAVSSGGSATANQEPATKSFDGKRVVCYYTNWAQYKPDPVKYSMRNLDTSLCTHVSFAFARINGLQLAPYEYNDFDSYRKLTSKARQDGNLKTLLAVGGWNFGSQTFTAMVNTSTNRNIFINFTVNYLRDHQFDGLELGWQFPASRGSPASDKQKFTLLCQELMQAFIKDGEQRKVDRLLLVAAVSSDRNQTMTSYEIEKLSKVLDWVNLMTYGMNDKRNVTELHAPLYGRSINDTFSVDAGVKMWLEGGMPADKIVLGLPTYGVTFQLSNQALYKGVFAPVDGPGLAGQYTQLDGFLAYYEICLNRELWQNKKRDSNGRQMYSWNSTGTWVSFDDAQTMYEKCLYMKNRNLGGVAIWSLDLDDFSGSVCNSGTYPVVRAISSCVKLSQPRQRLPLSASGSASTPASTAAAVSRAFTEDFGNSTASLSITHSPLVASPSVPREIVGSEQVNDEHKIICYYTNWAKYRPTVAAYIARNFSSSLCTHVSYAFATIRDHQLAMTEPDDSDALFILQQAKLQNPKLKILLAVGGAGFDNRIFLEIAGNSSLRRDFAMNVALFLRGNGFDGLDLAWLQRGEAISDQDKATYVNLCSDILQAFNEDSQSSQLERLILAASVSASHTSYDVGSLAGMVDWVTVMAYDFHNTAENQTGLTSALYPATAGNIQNANAAVQGWRESGMPSKKVVLGVAAYGRAFRLSGSAHDVGAPASGPCQQGQYTQEAGLYAYYEICNNNKFLKNKVRDEVTGGVYSWDDNGNWVTFEDPSSLQDKCSYVKDKNLTGMAVWAADLDDFSGRFCRVGRYPLLISIGVCFGRLTNDTVYNISLGESFKEIDGIKDTTSSTSRPTSQIRENAQIPTGPTSGPILVPRRYTTMSMTPSSSVAAHELLSDVVTESGCSSLFGFSTPLLYLTAFVVTRYNS